jgi:manganese/zinc/iron transport system permease protein
MCEYGIDYTGFLALSGATTFGCVAGMLGFFIVFRGYSLLVDVVCHATLPGTMIPYFFCTTIYSTVCMVGGIITGLLSVLLVRALQVWTALKIDAILGVVVSFFFGLGLVLITIIQKNGYAKQGVLHSLFLGNAGLYRFVDLVFLHVIALVIAVSLFIFFHRLYAVVFDPGMARVMGFSDGLYDCILCANLIMLASVGLLVMGSIVMSAAIIIPPVFAKQITRSFKMGIVISAMYGSLMGFCGTLLSIFFPNMPTGPLIAVCLGSGLIAIIIGKWLIGQVMHFLGVRYD